MPTVAILGALNCRVGEKLPAFLAPLIADVSGQGACRETQADFGARVGISQKPPVRDGARPTGDWGGDLAESRKGGGTRDDLRKDRR